MAKITSHLDHIVHLVTKRCCCVRVAVAGALLVGLPARAGAQPTLAPPEGNATIRIDFQIWLEDVLIGLGLEGAQPNELVLYDPAADRQDSGCGETIDSQIAGEFSGWDGETVFKLQNGQLWKQTSNQLSHANKHSPSVLIYWFAGDCKLKVTGMTDEISVQRLD